MAADGPKSAFELAMERVRQKDKEANIDDRALTEEQRPPSPRPASSTRRAA